MSRRIPLLVTVISLSALLPLRAVETELRLTSGEVVRGELVKQDDEAVVLRKSAATKNGVVSAEVRYARALVVEISRHETAADAYPDKAKAAADTAEAQTSLARWCAGQQLIKEATLHAKRALTLDAGYAPASAIMFNLGFHQVEGAWLDDEAWLDHQGLVRVGDKLMTKAAAAKRKELTLAAVARNQADELMRDKTHALNDAESQATAAATSADTLTAEHDELDKRVRDARQIIDQAQAKLTALKQRRDDASTQVQRELELYGQATFASTNALSKAQQEYDAEKRPIDQLSRQLAEDGARQRLVAQQLPVAQAASAAATAKRAKAAGELDAAKERLAQARQAAEKLQAEFSELSRETPVPHEFPAGQAAH